ncbi:macrophage mannose receptor 1-like [Arapaima gigas]
MALLLLILCGLLGSEKDSGSAINHLSVPSLCAVFSLCDEGWRPYNDRCYFFSDDTKTWSDAQADCERKGSNLMSILDIHERTWLQTQLANNIYWIGLNDIVSEDQWEWSDGSAYYPYLSYWKSGQPDSWGDNEDCVQVLGANDGQWNDASCTIRHRYICKRPNPNPVVVCDTANGWHQHASSCYKLKADTRKSWVSARLDCLREGGDLVSILSSEEEQYVISQLDSNDLWIGLSTLNCTAISCTIQAGNEVFHWSDASPPTDYLPWGDNEPNLSDKQNGVCAATVKEPDQGTGKWRSHVCRYQRPYMCKRALNTICPPGWLSFSGNCYWVVSNYAFLTSWHEAQTKCSSMSSNLVTIQSESEQFFINSLLPDFHHIEVPDIWIGVSDKDQDGSFNWVDKTPIRYSNWRTNFPQNTDKRWDCGQIYTGNYNGLWETTNCFKNLGYICKMAGGQNVKPTAAPDSHCDTGYLLFGDSCYHFENEMVKNWHDAETYCTNQNGHLASIHSEEEISFLSAHMTRSSWVGLNDIQTEGTYVWSDGTPTDFLLWDHNQPDNWQGNEDCIQVRGVDHSNPGTLNDQFCTSTFPFICKKAKGQGPPPVPPTTGPGWNQKCGFWTPDPFNDYCYLFNDLSIRNWADARADCVNQGGDLLSITEPTEQVFIQAQIQAVPTGIAMWMGGHDSITEGGWEWTDGSPFRYVHWAAGNPDDYYGEDCLSILVSTGYWNDDNCDYQRGYICKRRGNRLDNLHVLAGFNTAYVCEGSSAVITCPHNSVINIQAAFYGRKSDKICPFETGTDRTCEVPGTLALVRKLCDNREFCFLLAQAEEDPCPSVSKYMEVVYSCEQNVCIQGLGMENGIITDSHLSASSSKPGREPKHGRLSGSSCWVPSNPTNSWIQVNLGEVKKVTGVAIQGCPDADHWVKTFKVQSSTDGIHWENYDADGGTYLGSVDRNSKEKQLFGTPLAVQYIRVLPLEYNEQAGLRMDVLGCRPDYAVTCSSKISFNFDSDRKTVHCPAGCATEPYDVYGTTIYRGDSTICAAAIHAGVILNENGGDCTLLKMPGQSIYPGSTMNGITTKQYSGNFQTSFQFADGEMRCSGPDWHEFGDFCYKPFTDLKTWHAARSECRKLGADLVSILSITEQSWLDSYLYLATSDIWTGLNDLEFQGFFSWSDRHEVKFTYWAPGEPNNHAGFKEDCVEMLHQTGRWNDVPCTEINEYICKMPKDHYPVPSVHPTVYGCPEGWDAYSYSCYWMEEIPKTWFEAKAFCEAKDSKLLHIMDIYEQSYFTAKLAGFTGLWWIGLRAKGNIFGGFDYVWDNGAPVTFTHWDREQPDTGEGTCVAMTSGPIGGFWDDKACEGSFPFVCEKARDGISPPTRVPTAPPSQGCDPGWSSETGFRHCYKIFMMDYSQKKSWYDARQDCLSRGANLVSIHSGAEENFLSTYSKGRTKWVGLQHNAIDGGYQWSDGTALSYTNWGPGEPNNHLGQEDCVEMLSTTNGSSFWNDLNCGAAQDWICMISKGKKPLTPAPPIPPDPAPECGTNPGWRKHEGVCYYYNDTEHVDFYTAMMRCGHEKAHLVSILSKKEQEFVSSMVGTGNVEAAWIGLRMFGLAGGQFVWLDESPLSYIHWGPGEPNNANGEEQCVQINRYPGTWNDVNCGRDSAGYVCKKYPGNDHTQPPPTPPWTGHCPQGWNLFKNKCYMFKGNHLHEHEFKANWTVAQQWCRTQGGDLAVIDDQYENDFVASYLKDLVEPVWIGLSDILHEGKFAWSDGSQVLYTNWNEKEPNNAEEGEHCTAMSHNHLVTGRWNDDGCHLHRGWVCYMKKSNTIPEPPPTRTPCPPGYISWYNNCYKLVEEQKTWEEAQLTCQQEKGNLVSIDYSYDQAFVAGVVLQGKTDAWIGLRRKEGGDSYTWSDDWPVFFTNWGPGEPTNNKGEGCVSMHSNPHVHGVWNDTLCSATKPFICKITSDTPPPTPAPGDGNCRIGWWPYGHYCYFVHNGQKGFSWPESRYYCQLGNSELASLHSRAEVEFLRNINYTKYHNVWIGLTKDRHYGWGWTDQTSLGFVNWAPGEPNSAFHPGDTGKENCVEMYPDGRWNDNNCVQRRGFACRHRQPFSPGGIIAGAVIGALLAIGLICGLIYYMVYMKGVTLSDMKLRFGTHSRNTDVPNFSNPNFGGESES